MEFNALKALLWAFAIFILASVFFVLPAGELLAPVFYNQPQKKPVFNPENLKWELSISQAPFEKRDAHNLVAFKNKLWILGGVGGDAPDYSKNLDDIWVSEDGVNWQLVLEKAPWGPRRAAEALVFKNKLWILGGVVSGEKYSNEVWFSENGADWNLAVKNAGWLPRKGFASVVFNGKLWVMGGAATIGVVNDIWVSEDGVNWQLVLEKAPWQERYDLAAEAFLGKIWITGGVFPEDMGKKEIWFSENGKDWQKTDEPLWPGRHGHCFLAFKGYLWIIGGWSGYAHGYNDVWYSKNGIDWRQLYKDGKNGSPWKGREDLECANFKGQFFMTAGMETGGKRTNDVWHFTEK